MFNRKHVYLWRFAVGYAWLGCLVLSACGYYPGDRMPTSSVGQAAAISISVTSTSEIKLVPTTIVPETLMSPGATSTSMITNTSTPTSTATPRPTRTATPMPLLTLAPVAVVNLGSQEKLQIMDFLQEKPRCALPCWNGLTPGSIASPTDIQGFYARLGFDVTDQINQQINEKEWVIGKSLKNYPPGTGYQIPSVSLYVNKGIVQWIWIDRWNHPELFPVQRIHAVLGVPQEIKLDVSQGNDYGVLLHYLDRRIAIIIDGFLRQRSDHFDVCLEQNWRQDSTIYLYLPEAVDDALRPYALWEDWPAMLNVPTDDLFDMLETGCVLYSKH